MYFENLDAALQMNGHGIYVWPAYAVCIVVIVLLLLVPIRRHKRTLAQLAGELKRSNPRPRTDNHTDPLGGEP